MTDRASALAALRHRNFRLLWTGQLVSLVGSMMQTAAILWHVSTLVTEEDKPLALGLVGLVRVVPIVVFSLVGGVVADALDRRRLMLATQVAMTLFSGLLAWLTFRGLASTVPIYVLAGLTSAAASFDAPARQALLPSLVPRTVLPNALSLYSIMFQVASVLGPTLGGLVISAPSGLAWVYVLNTLSFLAVIVALLRMRDLPARAGGERRPVSLGAAAEGLRFVFREPLIRSTMLLDFFATFFASATALLPIFAQDILKVGAHGYGLLVAAPSIGALVAGVAMVRYEPRILRRGRVLLYGVAAYGLATVVFGLSRSFALTFACLAASGAADTVSMVLRNIIRQLRTPDEIRGRMTSVNMVFFMGGPQLGELEAGVVAHAIGAPLSVVTGGIGCLLSVAWVWRSTPELRDHLREEHGEGPATGGIAHGAPAPPPAGTRADGERVAEKAAG